MGASLKNIHLGEVQPICSECGIRLCWTISIEEYSQYMAFWDEWTCEFCNPDYKGQFKRYKELIDSNNNKQ